MQVHATLTQDVCSVIPVGEMQSHLLYLQLTGGAYLQAYIVIKSVDTYGNAVAASSSADSDSGYNAEISGAEVTSLLPYYYLGNALLCMS